MRRVNFRNLTWLGLLGLLFTLITVPAAVAQSKKASTAAPTAKSAVTGAKVDINNATQKELENLPGVGAATAKKIIAGRPYTSAADLGKAGVPKTTIAKITPLVAVGVASAAPPAPKAEAKTAPAPTPMPTPTAPTAARPAKPAPAAQAAFTPPPAPGMVWVNLESKVYHKEGDSWYGKTKKGKYMTEADAIKAGYRAARAKQNQ